ncbi:MAG: hypothetical protein GX800_11370 [Clostridiaceae bacterium]|jgi:P27 family predicted phage terminase small subunit|nr:hypothetical protein [Clostridiaceae bacterium]
MDNLPKSLRSEGKRFYQKIMLDYSIDDEAGKALLQTASEAWDRCKDAQSIIRKDGLILIDRFGQKKPHPACAIERDSRAAVVSALKALNLSPGVM